MAVQITIRDVPEDVRDELAARAARERRSMQEYLRLQLERIVSGPSIDEWVCGRPAAKGSGGKPSVGETLNSRFAQARCFVNEAG